MNRAVFYQSHGDPSSVLSAVTYPALPAPSQSSVNLRVLLSPVNPSDINVVQGVYPLQPEPRTIPTGRGSDEEQTICVPGNEGLAQVEDVGSSVKSLSKGDWVIFAKKQSGTWSSGLSVSEDDVIKLAKADGLSDVHAATLSVNPATAYNMLKDFVDLEPGDWVLQNGANSAVGQAVIQIAASRGLKTINFIRNRENVDELKKYLTDLGATQVLTYDDLEDKSITERVGEWTGGKDIRLLLNCIGDKSTTRMFRLLGQNAQIVTYGGMAKTSLALPPGLLIFKNLVFRGFWQSLWYTQKSREERLEMTQHLIKLISEGKLKEPAHEIVTINGKDDDATTTKTVRELMAKVSDGTYGKKVLMKIEPVDA